MQKKYKKLLVNEKTFCTNGVPLFIQVRSSSFVSNTFLHFIYLFTRKTLKCHVLLLFLLKGVNYFNKNCSQSIHIYIQNNTRLLVINGELKLCIYSHKISVPSFILRYANSIIFDSIIVVET